MLTFNQEKKDFFIDRMKGHQYADRVAEGEWWDGKKEPFFGCAMETEYNHLGKAAEEMELPKWLVCLGKAIFEGLPPELALEWPVKLLEAVPVETDISEVMHRLSGAELERAVLRLDKSVDKSGAESEAESAWAARAVARAVERSAWHESWSLEADNLIKILEEFKTDKQELMK